MKSSTICQEWLDSLPPTEGYLKNEQSIGREFLLEKGMPSKKDEAWRLSNFNKLNSFLSLPTIIDSKCIKSVFPEKDENRERIVGIVPVDKKTSIPEGSYIVENPNAEFPIPKLGHVSASCWSVEHNNPFSLAIIKNGKNRKGEKLFAVSPVKNMSIPVEVVSQHYVDPDGERVRS